MITLNADAQLRVAEPSLRRFAASAGLHADLSVARIDDVMLAVTTLVGMAGDREARRLAMTCAASPRQLDMVVTALGADGAVAIGDDPRVHGVSVLRMLADQVEQEATRLRLRFTADEGYMTL